MHTNELSLLDPNPFEHSDKRPKGARELIMLTDEVVEYQ